MRLVVARCEVVYSGRLNAYLPPSTRLLVLKADGSVLVHADAGGFKPLNGGKRPPPGGVVSGLGSTILGPGPRRTQCSRCSITPLLARLGIRFAAALAGIAIGIVVSSALLDDFAATATGVVIATVLFWIIHIVVQFLALRVLIRQPSIALAGLLALCSTIVSLVIVNLLVDDISISGATTYVLATLIIWLCTAVADIAGGRLIRARRREDRT